jgi:signal transduction histidine kinase
MNFKSVKSQNPFESPEYLGTGVTQTFMVKAHGGELSVVTTSGTATIFTIELPFYS